MVTSSQAKTGALGVIAVLAVPATAAAHVPTSADSISRSKTYVRNHWAPNATSWTVEINEAMAPHDRHIVIWYYRPAVGDQCLANLRWRHGSLSPALLPSHLCGFPAMRAA